jgi:hypothetical protein
MRQAKRLFGLQPVTALEARESTRDKNQRRIRRTSNNSKYQEKDIKKKAVKVSSNTKWNEVYQ